MAKNYKCELCDQVFENEEGWTKADAERDVIAAYGFRPPTNEMVSVCEDCYKIVALHHRKKITSH